MPGRLSTRVVAALCAAALLCLLQGGTASAAEPQPGPDPAMEVTFEAMEGDDLVGTVTCDPSTTARVFGQVHQEDGVLPIRSYGSVEIECGPEPVDYRVRVVGNGVLARGTVAYQVDVGTLDGEFGDATDGELTLRRPVDVAQAPPDDGDLPIHISPVAGTSSEGPVARGSITCDQPRSLDVVVRGWQWLGRYQLPLTGRQQISCDGKTPFAVPFTSELGQLRPGLATVTIVADHSDWPYAGDGSGAPYGPPEVNRKTQRVIVRSSTPEPDFPVPPDGDARLAIGDVRRVGEVLEVDVVDRACRAGERSLVAVSVRPLRTEYRGRWLDPSTAAERADVRTSCTAEGAGVTLEVPDTFDGDEVVVGATSWGEYGQLSNAATVTVDAG